jgi:hypothetical protein
VTVRSLAEFKKALPDEEACTAYSGERRWPDGFVCPGCTSRRGVLLKKRTATYQCLDCYRQRSVAAVRTSAAAGRLLECGKMAQALGERPYACRLIGTT